VSTATDVFSQPLYITGLDSQRGEQAQVLSPGTIYPLTFSTELAPAVTVGAGVAASEAASQLADGSTVTLSGPSEPSWWSAYQSNLGLSTSWPPTCTTSGGGAAAGGPLSTCSFGALPPGNWSVNLDVSTAAYNPIFPLYVSVPNPQAVAMSPGTIYPITFDTDFLNLNKVVSGSGSVTTLDGALSATGGGGTGVVTVGEYASNPEGSPAFGVGGQYFDVYLAPDSTFTSLAFSECVPGGGTSLSWWNPQANGGSGGWDPVLGDPGPTYSIGPPPCLSVMFSGISSPSISQLIGTVFAVALAPRAVSSGAPGAPSGVIATRSDGQTKVSWTPPSDVGSSSIISYTIQYSSNDGTTWTTATTVAAGTSDVVTGLTNGTSYVFEVAATNAAGTGAYSALSAAVTSATTPGAPTSVTAASTAGGRSEVTWIDPTSDGGTAITSYTVQYSSNEGTTWTTATTVATGTSDVVTGLTNGTSYVFEVAATNATGTGAYSALSAAVTPGGDAVVKLVSKKNSLASTAKLLPIRIACRNASCVGVLIVTARLAVKIKHGPRPGVKVETITFGSARFRLARDSTASVSIHLSGAGKSYLESNPARPVILASVFASGGVHEQGIDIGTVLLLK
ncbi:MAG TPA: fibronectin type III domain-containing protein, partial [Acidimicrobiales bacterium]|nr:fibronectin type III domain-containing protein [Acidimicrobiales bacterium]